EHRLLDLFALLQYRALVLAEVLGVVLVVFRVCPDHQRESLVELFMQLLVPRLPARERLVVSRARRREGGNASLVQCEHMLVPAVDLEKTRAVLGRGGCMNESGSGRDEVQCKNAELSC